MYNKNKHKNGNKKIIVTMLLFIFVLVISGVLYLFINRSSQDRAESEDSNNSHNVVVDNKVDDGKIRLIATGDWIAHDSVNLAAETQDGNYDYYPLVSDFKPVFDSADIKFCNDPILNGGAISGVAGYPKFNSPPEFVTGMGKLGCNLVNMASNHSFDRTQAEITASVEAWEKVSDVYAASGQNASQAQHDSVSVFDVEGIKIGYLAYTSYINVDAPVQNDYGVNVYSEEFAKKQIDLALSQGAQYIIVSMRWGTEYSTAVNPKQIQIAKYLATLGVDLVIGHGSHMLQPVQEIESINSKKTTVWYGIGNFLNTQIPPETLVNGLPIIEIDKSTLSIDKMKFLPTYMSYQWSADQASSEDVLSRDKLHMYLLEDASQAMFDAQQLTTTIEAQTNRMTSTLSEYGLTIPFTTSAELWN